MVEKDTIEKYLKLIMDKLDQQEKAIQKINERLSAIEKSRLKAEEAVDMPASLIRVLKVLIDEEKPLGTEEVAKKLGLSRNLTSNYLKRLVDLGYVIKEPNLEGRGPRYIFRANMSAIPEKIKKLYLKRVDDTHV